MTLRIMSPQRDFFCLNRNKIMTFPPQSPEVFRKNKYLRPVSDSKLNQKRRSMRISHIIQLYRNSAKISIKLRIKTVHQNVTNKKCQSQKRRLLMQELKLRKICRGPLSMKCAIRVKLTLNKTSTQSLQASEVLQAPAILMPQ